jgi:hypothetical protein
MTELASESPQSLFEPRQARRVRWCSVLASLIFAAHFFSAIVLFGWYYWIVPRWKFEFQDHGFEPTPQSFYVFAISDVVIVGLFLLIVIAPVTLILDFIATRWIARHVGLRWASLVGLSVVLLMLANIAIGHYILVDAKAQLWKQLTDDAHEF